MTDYTGKIVKARRTVADLSRQELADKAGVAKITVGRIERGQSVSLRTLASIAKALGVSTADLIEPPKRRRAS